MLLGTKKEEKEKKEQKKEKKKMEKLAQQAKKENNAKQARKTEKEKEGRLTFNTTGSFTSVFPIIVIPMPTPGLPGTYDGPNDGPPPPGVDS